MHAYVERYAVGRAFVSPADLSWRRDDVVVQPDIFVVSPADARAERWESMRRFELIVEVLSASSARYDRFTKRLLYQEMRVPLYWVLDIGARRAEVWTPAATVPVYEGERLVWRPEAVSEEFSASLTELMHA